MGALSFYSRIRRDKVQINYTDECRVGELTYAVEAQTDDSGVVRLRLCGVDGGGVLAAEGTLQVPSGALIDASTVLRRALIGLGKLQPPKRRGQTGGPANSFQPWTAELSGQLRESWLSKPESTPASELICELAGIHGRSRNAIRAQLAKVGCDPDVPGRALRELAAADG